MEMLKLSNQKYIAKCSKCSETFKFTINYEHFCVSGECKRGHKISHIPFKIFQDKYIIKSNSISKKCLNCFKEIDDMSVNYKCLECNKLICSNCINKHKKFTGHESKIEFIQQNQLCPIHNKKYTLFCEKCNINLCSNCQDSHENHSLKSYSNIIPNKRKQDLAENKYTAFHFKIRKLKKELDNFLNKIEEKYRFSIDFLDFLDETSDNIINNFNINCFDYYNYENFNYLLKLFDDKKVLDYSKYKDKMVHNSPLKKFRCTKVTYEKIIFNINSSNKIDNTEKIEHLKDNFFYLFESKCLKLFEYKDFSFNFVTKYNLSNYKVKDVRLAKYTNEFLLNAIYYNKIKFLKYDLNNKVFKLSKKQIKIVPFHLFNYYLEYYDNANGNIITFLTDKITVWKKQPKKNSYKEILTIKDVECSINVINESLFCFQDVNYNIHFYDSNIYKCLQIINNEKKIRKFLGLINNEIGLFVIGTKLNLISIKYLEIVQILDIFDNYFDNYVLNKNNLLFFERKNNKVKIDINNFNENEKCFFKGKTYETDIEISYITKTLIVNENTLIICNYSNIIFVDLNMMK